MTTHTYYCRKCKKKKIVDENDPAPRCEHKAGGGMEIHQMYREVREGE